MTDAIDIQTMPNPADLHQPSTRESSDEIVTEKSSKDTRSAAAWWRVLVATW